MKWPTEHTDYLKQLMAEGGYSGAQVARMVNDRFRTSYTRNAIIGKLNRLGMATTRAVKVDRPKAATPVRRTAFVDRQQPAQARDVDTRTVSPAALNITLSELEDGMCKWVTDTRDGTRYCGVATSGRRVSYCACHQNAGTEPARHRSVGWSEVSRQAGTRSRGVLR
jgi:hypothetical protein